MFYYEKTGALLQIFWGEEFISQIAAALFTTQITSLAKSATKEELLEELDRLERRVFHKKAIALLSRRSYFSLELAAKMEQLYFSKELTHEMLLELKKYYFDDDFFVDSFILNQLEKLRSPYAITQKLIQKYVPLSWIESRLQALYTAARKERIIAALKRKTGKEGYEFAAYLYKKGFCDL